MPEKTQLTPQPSFNFLTQPPELATDDFLTDLNQEQLAAVTHTKGPLMIVAGAGTGKTTVLTKKLFYLLKNKLAKPEQILALTFSTKAAEEMQERIDSMLPLGYEDLWISTFHSFCERILRDHALDIGLPLNFKILTPAETWLFVRKHLFEFKLDYYRPLGNPAKFIVELLKHFSRAKDEDISPDEYLAHARALQEKAITEEEKSEANRLMEIAQSYGLYQQLMRENGFLDFGDLIIYTLHLFRTRPKILKTYQDQFKYVLIDEFQDTNFSQYQLLKLLAPPQNNFIVTGDDNQSIYKFRGASVSNILQFKTDFPDATQIVLTQNYRSTQKILDAAYASIQLNNPETLETKLGISKKLQSNSNAHNVEPHIVRLDSKDDEVKFALAEILRLRRERPELNWKDFAILFRANAHAEPFIEYFQKTQIPYYFAASTGLYMKPEIMDLLSFLRVIRDVSDNVSMYRVMNIDCFHIKSTDVLKIMFLARKKGVSYVEMLLRIDQIIGLTPQSQEGCKRLAKILEEHVVIAKRKPVGEVLLSFLENSAYLESFNGDPIHLREERILIISQLFSKIQEIQEAGKLKFVQEFIDELDLMIEAGDDPAPAQIDEGPDAVRLMTIHQAKGLEFPVVFMTNLVEQRFPTIQRKESIEIPRELIKDIIPEGNIHVQEERRLFYVALTRAKDHLYLTSAKKYGSKRENRLSRFVKEIERDLLVNDTFEDALKEFAAQSGLTIQAPTQKNSVVPPRAAVKIPNRLSYTQLVAFENCPYQYRFAHILKIPSRGSHTFSYGKSIHSSLQIFYKQVMAGVIPTLDELLNIYRGAWISEWYINKKHENEQRAQGEQALRNFYKRNVGNFQPPLFLEKGFTVGVGPYKLFGYIDRVDKFEDGIEIIDYKTGKLGKTSEQLEKEMRRDKQLGIYALAMRRVFNLNPRKLSLYFLDRDEKISIDADPDHLESVDQDVIEIAQKMQTSDFKATPNRFLCAHCDFRTICEFSAA